MNYIVGFSLLLVSEEETFWLLVCIVEDLCAGFYSKSMIGIQVNNLKNFLKKILFYL